MCVYYLHIEKNGSNPHCFTDLQVVGGEGEAWGALIVGGQNLNVDCCDGAPSKKKSTNHLNKFTSC